MWIMSTTTAKSIYPFFYPFSSSSSLFLLIFLEISFMYTHIQINLLYNIFGKYVSRQSFYCKCEKMLPKPRATWVNGKNEEILDTHELCMWHQNENARVFFYIFSDSQHSWRR